METNTIKNNEFLFIAGPCAIESFDQYSTIISYLEKLNIKYIRGGMFKPRTSPLSFQGIRQEGFKIIKEVKSKHDIKVVSEIVSTEFLNDFIDTVDIIQVGARNMYNYELLKALGRTDKTIILKRHFGATVEEFISASQYITTQGNPNVILCERGIRTLSESSRFTLDLASVPLLKEKTGLKIIIDPSHAAGDAKLVPMFAKCAIMAGADGLMIEVHNRPCESLCDKDQAISLADFANLKKEIDQLLNLYKIN